MCAWLQAVGELVEPLVSLMADRVKQSRVIHTDETSVPVQAPGTGRCRKGRIWTYIGDHDHPYVVYHYTPDRTRAGPSNWLAGCKGYLQADAYGGYDGIYHQGDVTEVACWAHARRKFFDAQSTQKLLELAEQSERIEALRVAIGEMRQGKGIPAEDVLAEMRQILAEIKA